MRDRLKAWLRLLPFASILVAGPSAASPEPHAVLELFVSQGCSACRGANEYMTELKRDPGLVVLSLAVNYWDYLGWKDTLADPQFTARQKGYALVRKNHQVYTPEMVVNGVQSCLGSARDKVRKTVEQASAGRTPLPVPVDVWEEDGMIVVDIGAGTEEATAWLLPVLRSSRVPIHRGENAGRTETYVNVVRGLHRLGDWAGTATRFRTPLDTARTQGADSYVVLLQRDRDGKPGPILGVAKGPGL